MGRKSINKEKPKKARPFTKADIGGSSNLRLGERSLIQLLEKDKGAPFIRSGLKPLPETNKNFKKEA